ncbi:MAG: butyrate kinase [Solobacterium sp.]|nr:butyrate kinase [Solobacterium sp.]
MTYQILAINPGSTSTKIALFEDETLVKEITLDHPISEIEKYDHIMDQLEFRKKVIVGWLNEIGFDMKTLDAVSGRGGLVKAIPGGTYAVNRKLVDDLHTAVNGEHASNLGGVLAREIADEVGCRAFIVDPPSVDDFDEISRISGMPDIQRISKFHALNHRAVAREYARKTGRKYRDLNLIVAHMGGGGSVAAHRKGKAINCYNGLDGDGAFSPTRSGGIPSGDLIRLCYSGKYPTVNDMMKRCVGNAGIVAYLGTNDMREVNKMIEEGNEQARLVKEAFILQVSHDIAAMAADLKGEVDQIILTGGIAHGKDVTDAITDRIGWIAGVTVIPGEREMLALAQGAYRVLSGEEEAQVYE